MMGLHFSHSEDERRNNRRAVEGDLSCGEHTDTQPISALIGT